MNFKSFIKTFTNLITKRELKNMLEKEVKSTNNIKERLE